MQLTYNFNTKPDKQIQMRLVSNAIGLDELAVVQEKKNFRFRFDGVSYV